MRSHRPRRKRLFTQTLNYSLTLTLLLSACTGSRTSDTTTITFWGFGREGEAVNELVPEFERTHPGIEVQVQQIPWTAAHEKLLTAFVGDAMPDLAQLGNTWVPEFQLLGALEDLDPWVARSESVQRHDFFEGIWETNVIEGVTYGLPWYVDTRLLFYRTDLLREAGYDEPPKSWAEWVEIMHALVDRAGAEYAILLPTNEWQHPMTLAMQTGSQVLTDHATRANFTSPEFRKAISFYVSLFEQELAPSLARTQVSNVYQEFARGYFAMYMSGPWQIGEFKRFLPEELQDDWMTAPMPGPSGEESGYSLAGGSSVVLFSQSSRKEAAWKFAEFLALPETQARFYEITGNLPARMSTWELTDLQNETYANAFWEQLQRVRPTPQVPEWERIATKVYEHVDRIIRGSVSVDQALEALDRDVNEILEKRRWMLARAEEDEA